jgi:flagellar assembly protein FliH
MKSFSKTIRSEQASCESWKPSDLGVEWVEPAPDVRKQQILSIFQKEEDQVDKTEAASRSALHSGRDFTAWLPGEMAAQPKAARKTEWFFVETVPDMENSQVFEFDVFEETPAPNEPDTEKQAAQILEQARLQADEIILAAQAEADNILLQAQAEIDEQKEEAYRQGTEQARGELKEALKTVHVVVDEVHQWQAELASQGESLLLEMLKEIAQKLFGEGVELDTNALQMNLNRIMETARGLGDLNIFLNPKDAKNLDPSWSEYQMLVSGDKVKIIPSGKITRGGCFVKGEMGIVDGRVEVQLEAILKALDESSESAE